MKDGMGEEHDMAPEAHNEWKDKAEKHAVSPHLLGDMGSNLTPTKDMGKKASDFEPMKGPKQGSTKEHEKKSVSKWKDQDKYLSPMDSAGAANTKHRSGPMKHAGKGSEGQTRGAAGKGKLNSGNGIRSGKKVKGL